MKHNLTCRLLLERLETRDCPSLTVTSYFGNLTVTGTPTGALMLQETSPDQFHITDGATNKGTFAGIDNIRVNLTRHADTVDIDVDGNRLGGNLSINLGNGDTTGISHPVSVYSSVANGSVGGSITFLNGSGTETLNIGKPTNGAAFTLAVGGSVTAVGRKSGGGNFGIGDTLFINPGSSVGGDLTTSQIDTVDIGELGGVATINGNVTIGDGGSGTFLAVEIFGNINHNVTVTGTVFDDVFSLQQANAVPGGGGLIGGNLNVNFGLGAALGNFLLLDVGTIVGGSATLSTQGGNANDAFIDNGTVSGDLIANMGDGNNSFSFSATAVVNGNMRINGGNGANDLTSFDGIVNGNLIIHLGNGANTAVFTNAPAGQLIWTSGNGNNSLTLGDAATTTSQAWDIMVGFGNGNDTLALGTTGAGTIQTLNGLVSDSGAQTTNTLTQSDNWLFGGKLAFINFP